MITENTIKLFLGLLLFNLLPAPGHQLQAQYPLEPRLEVNPDISAYVEDWVHVYSIVLHVENTTHGPIEFCIQAVMYNGNGDRVAQASRSPSFVAHPGANAFLPAQFFLLQDFEFFGGIEEPVRKEGRLKEDNYQLCYLLKAKNGQPLSDEQDGCGYMDIEACQNPIPAFPEDGSSFTLEELPFVDFELSWDGPPDQLVEFFLVKKEGGFSNEENIYQKEPEIVQKVGGQQAFRIPAQYTIEPGEYLWGARGCENGYTSGLDFSSITIIDYNLGKVEECECTCEVEIIGPDKIVPIKNMVFRQEKERCFEAIIEKDCSPVADWSRIEPQQTYPIRYWTGPEGWTSLERHGHANDVANTKICFQEITEEGFQNLNNNLNEITISYKGIGYYYCKDDGYTVKKVPCEGSKTIKVIDCDPAKKTEASIRQCAEMKKRIEGVLGQANQTVAEAAERRDNLVWGVQTWGPMTEIVCQSLESIESNCSWANFLYWGYKITNALISAKAAIAKKLVEAVVHEGLAILTIVESDAGEMIEDCEDLVRQTKNQMIRYNDRACEYVRGFEEIIQMLEATLDNLYNIRREAHDLKYKDCNCDLSKELGRLDEAITSVRNELQACNQIRVEYRHWFNWCGNSFTTFDAHIICSAPTVPPVDLSEYESRSNEVGNKSDLNGDGQEEEMEENALLPPSNSELVDIDGDQKPDKVILGTAGNVSLSTESDPDGDSEMELIFLDTARPPGNFIPVKLDKDTDFDIIVIGIGPKGRRIGNKDIDKDNEDELIIEDAAAPAGTFHDRDIDNDGDIDIRVIGTG